MLALLGLALSLSKGHRGFARREIVQVHWPLMNLGVVAVLQARSQLADGCIEADAFNISIG